MVRAAQNAINLDERKVNAVAARVELDLRIGAAFTRFTTLTLQTMGGNLSDRVISYGQLLKTKKSLLNTLPDIIQGLVNFPRWVSL